MVLRTTVVAVARALQLCPDIISRIGVTGSPDRRKFRQILESFQDEPMDNDHPKYVCAPCSNCKGQIRDIISYYDAWEKAGIYYGGLVELMVNAMEDATPGFIDWEWR